MIRRTPDMLDSITLKKLLNSEEENCGLLSEIICSGKPYVAKIVSSFNGT